MNRWCDGAGCDRNMRRRRTMRRLKRWEPAAAITDQATVTATATDRLGTDRDGIGMQALACGPSCQATVSSIAPSDGGFTHRRSYTDMDTIQDSTDGPASLQADSAAVSWAADSVAVLRGVDSMAVAEAVASLNGRGAITFGSGSRCGLRCGLLRLP